MSQRTTLHQHHFPAADLCKTRREADLINNTMEWFRLHQSSYIASKTPSVRFQLQNEYTSRLSALHQGVPVVVLSFQDDDDDDHDHDEYHPVDRESVEARLQQLLAGDDVICPEFTKTILLAGVTEEIDFVINGSDIYAVEMAVPLRSGPYYARSSHLHFVYKLQEDPYEAFMMGVLPDSGDHDS